MRAAATVLIVTLGFGAVSAAEEPEETVDPRSHELLLLDCSSRLTGTELTLFANGTLRLRERTPAGPEMTLAELDRVEVADYVGRLEAEGWPGEQGLRRGVGGEWVDQCLLTVELQPGSPRRLRFSRLDTLPIGFARLVAIADELLAEALRRRVGRGFPADYEVRIGDVVRRADGSEFAVRGFTSDGAGVELEGLEQPVVLYLERAQISSEFTVLVRRRP